MNLVETIYIYTRKNFQSLEACISELEGSGNRDFSLLLIILILGSNF